MFYGQMSNSYYQPTNNLNNSNSFMQSSNNMYGYGMNSYDNSLYSNSLYSNNAYGNNTSYNNNMYSANSYNNNPIISRAIQPLPIYQPQNNMNLFNTQSFLPMTNQISYANQSYSNLGFAPAQQQSTNSIFMLLSLFLNNFKNILPVTTEETVEAEETTTANQTATEFFQDFIKELIGLSDLDEKETAQNTKIDDNTAAITANNAKDLTQDTAITANTAAITANDAKDLTQDTAITANTAAITANDAKDLTQDTAIADLKAQIAALTQTLAQNTAKDTAQDTAIEKLATPEFLSKNLSTAELNWLKSSDIDLTTVGTDGSPKYLVAKGQRDGKYHVYQQLSGTTYKSVIGLAQGNNYLYTKDEASNKNMANISKSIGGDFVMNQGRYSTGSPLILDTNENGTIESQQGIGVDVDQNGKADGAATKGDKMLAMSDVNGSGKIDGTEVFGNETIDPFTGKKIEATNGFEALKQVALSAEAKTGLKIIENNKVNLEKLQEALKSIGVNLGLISDDNVTELEALGNISKIGLDYQDKNDDVDFMISNSNSDSVSLQNGSYETTDGKTNKIDDVWFKLNN